MSKHVACGKGDSQAEQRYRCHGECDTSIHDLLHDYQNGCPHHKSGTCTSVPRTRYRTSARGPARPCSAAELTNGTGAQTRRRSRPGRSTTGPHQSVSLSRLYRKSQWLAPCMMVCVRVSFMSGPKRCLPMNVPRFPRPYFIPGRRLPVNACVTREHPISQAL